MATRDIEPGEEFLLDYGEAYTNAFLLPKPKSPDSNISAGVMESELPGGLVEEDERESLIDLNKDCGEIYVNENIAVTAIDSAHSRTVSLGLMAISITASDNTGNSMTSGIE